MQVRAGGKGGLSHHDNRDTSDETIRKMMAEQRRAQNLRSLPDIMPETSDDDRAAITARHMRRQAWNNALDTPPASHYDAETEGAGRPRTGFWGRFVPGGRKRGVRRPARRARPPRGAWVAVSLASVLIFQPTLIPGLLMMAFWVLFVASLLFGPGRVVDFLLGLWGVLLRHNPVLAGKLRQIGDTAARWARAGLSRLPGKLGNRWSSTDRAGDRMNSGAEVKEGFDRRRQSGVFRG